MPLPYPTGRRIPGGSEFSLLVRLVLNSVFCKGFTGKTASVRSIRGLKALDGKATQAQQDSARYELTGDITKMSFSINTNIASLEAQNYLRMDSNFQTS